MKRICPTCFAELPEEANYCPTCGKCVREVEERIIQYTDTAPQTKAVSIKDRAVSIGGFDEKARQRKMNSALNQLELKDGHIFLDGMMLKGITRFNLAHKGGESSPELTLKMDVRTLPKFKALQCQIKNRE
ncbi:hypothetical protein JCM37173_31290 [Allocoprococcus similis]